MFPLSQYAPIMAPPTHHLLYARDQDDNMGYAISPNLIMLFLLLGTGFIIAMLYGMHRMTGFGGQEADAPRPTLER